MVTDSSSAGYEPRLVKVTAVMRQRRSESGAIFFFCCARRVFRKQSPAWAKQREMKYKKKIISLDISRRSEDRVECSADPQLGKGRQAAFWCQ